MEAQTNFCHPVRSYNEIGSSQNRPWNIVQFLEIDQDLDEDPIRQNEANSEEIRNPSLHSGAIEDAVEVDVASLVKKLAVPFATEESLGNLQRMQQDVHLPSRVHQDSQIVQHNQTSLEEIAHNSRGAQGPAPLLMQNGTQIPDTQQQFQL